MEGFQKIVLTTAIILLVLALIAFAVVLYNRKFNQEYPPVTAECPDYWVDIIGTCLNKTFLFNHYPLCLM